MSGNDCQVSDPIILEALQLSKAVLILLKRIIKRLKEEYDKLNVKYCESLNRQRQIYSHQIYRFLKLQIIVAEVELK